MRWQRQREEHHWREGYKKRNSEREEERKTERKKNTKKKNHKETEADKCFLPATLFPEVSAPRHLTLPLQSNDDNVWQLQLLATSGTASQQVDVILVCAPVQIPPPGFESMEHLAS